MCKITLNERIIHTLLPQPPDGYDYEVERFSPLVWRVWLTSHTTFDYSNTTPRTIWGFIKSTGFVYPPKNADKPQRAKLCHIQDIPESLRYTTIVPKYTVLNNAD